MNQATLLKLVKKAVRQIEPGADIILYGSRAALSKYSTGWHPVMNNVGTKDEYIRYRLERAHNNMLAYKNLHFPQ